MHFTTPYVWLVWLVARIESALYGAGSITELVRKHFLVVTRVLHIQISSQYWGALELMLRMCSAAGPLIGIDDQTLRDQNRTVHLQLHRLPT
jgi:hypothetical protein